MGLLLNPMELCALLHNSKLYTALSPGEIVGAKWYDLKVEVIDTASAPYFRG